MRSRGGSRQALHRLRTVSPRRRRAQLGGAVALCALATGSTGALLVVANAGVDLVRITPTEPGAAPVRADRLPAGRAGSAMPSREPAFGWSEREARRPYVAGPSGAAPSTPPVSSSPGPVVSRTPDEFGLPEEWPSEPEEPWTTEYEPSSPGESGAATPEAEPASPGEGSVRSTDAAPDSAGRQGPAVGRVRVRPGPNR